MNKTVSKPFVEVPVGARFQNFAGEKFRKVNGDQCVRIHGDGNDGKVIIPVVSPWIVKVAESVLG